MKNTLYFILILIFIYLCKEKTTSNNGNRANIILNKHLKKNKLFEFEHVCDTVYNNNYYFRTDSLYFDDFILIHNMKFLSTENHLLTRDNYIESVFIVNKDPIKKNNVLLLTEIDATTIQLPILLGYQSVDNPFGNKYYKIPINEIIYYITEGGPFSCCGTACYWSYYIIIKKTGDSFDFFVIPHKYSYPYSFDNVIFSDCNNDNNIDFYLYYTDDNARFLEKGYYIPVSIINDKLEILRDDMPCYLLTLKCPTNDSCFFQKDILPIDSAFSNVESLSR